MKQIRWRVRFGKGQEKTVRHFCDAYKLAEALRGAGMQVEIEAVEPEGLRQPIGESRMANVKFDPRFGRGMRKLMEREELTGRMLAEFAGVDSRTVSRIKCLVTTPSEPTKELIAAVFRMTAREVEALGEKAKAD